MTDAAVTFVLENVAQLVKSYADLISGAKEELETLNQDLGLLKAFLQQAAKRPKKEDDLFREMEKQIREVVYDAEDTIVSCVTQAAAARTGCKPVRGLGRRVSLAKQVKFLREQKVKEKFKQAQASFDKMLTADGPGTTGEEPGKRVKKDDPSIFKQDSVVVLEDQEKQIIDYLSQESEDLDVIPIIGMPGLGKTTLARKIFQNPNIQCRFSACIWVYVSQEFDVKDVFLKIVKHFASEIISSRDMSSMSADELAEEGRKYLQTAKFLLVMDDVWTTEAWTELEKVLPKSNNKGKVLITSRTMAVGTRASVTRKPHELRLLEPGESWELLQLKVFGKPGHCPKDLEETGQNIAKQCDGLPLAIEFIGGILLDQLSKARGIAIHNAWTKVSEKVRVHVKNDEQGMSVIAAWSYDNLPNDLRDCFLYLGVFPEDYEIPAWTLTRLWIAEGFIQYKEGETLEETAQENLKDLIDRNLVMVVKTKSNGEVKTCRVHDVIHQFCKANADIKKQNLFQEMKKSKEGVFEPLISDLQKYRRLCIHLHLLEFLSKCVSGKHKGRRVRSLLCFYKESILLDPKYNSAIPDTFSLLRILDSRSVKFTKFPEKVIRLTHLRYITLSCDVNFLPVDITKLWNLQTLVVDTSSPTLEIRGSIWKLTQLRHLMTKATIILAAQVEGEGGENLQTLSRLSPKNCTQDVFGRASNLNRLGVRGNLAILFKVWPLGRLNRLENLKLVNDLSDGSAHEESEDPLLVLPPAKSFPQNIKTLTLSNTFLEWKHMSTLGQILTLQVLKLKQNAFTGKSWQVVEQGFGSLQFLLIASTDLRKWKVPDDKDHFPRLRCLVLKNCSDLWKIPFCLKQTLQELHVERISRTATTSAREIYEYKTRMQGQQKGRWDTEFKLTIC